MLPQQYCLRWRYHHSNLQTMFTQLLERQAFCDVTLACDGKIIKAHKIVLSACSTYFETILSQYEEKDPILIMKDIKYIDIKCLVEFMYKGEINVDHCHLATLLKTAEELKIKGLAEVSWRDDDNNNNNNNSNNSSNGNNQNGDNCLQSSALQQVSTVMENPKSDTPINNNNNHYHSNNNNNNNSNSNSNSGNNNSNNNNNSSSNKRKRGRPPIDDYEQTFTTPKIMNVTGNADETYSNDAMSTSDHDLSIWEEDHQLSANEYGGSGVGGGGGDITETDEPLVKIKKETNLHDDDGLLDDNVGQYSPTDSKHDSTSRAGSTKSLTTTNVTTSGTQSFLTPALEKEWPDVIKMNDYLNTGRRQQFWEEPFTKRVMDAIKTKNLEMKVAAELLGVSYGTLYGRYRDSYGCLKHPYRVRDFWSEQGPTDVLLKLKKKEITLYRAAEQLNVTPQTLSNYLISMSQIENNDTNFNNNSSNNNNQSMECYTNNNNNNNNNNNGNNDDDDEDEEEDDDQADTDDDDDDDVEDNKATISNKTSLFKKFLSNQSASNTVLANCPDITIIKKEKHDSKINNNSDHSDNNSDHTK